MLEIDFLVLSYKWIGHLMSSVTSFMEHCCTIETNTKLDSMVIVVTIVNKCMDIDVILILEFV